MLSQRFTLRVVSALSLLFLVSSSDAQQSSLQRSPSMRRSTVSSYYYAVLGAVAAPGVYEYSSGLSTLADVIHAADGLTSEASGTFRIVREGKVSRQMFYSPGSKMRLLSQDIIILDRSLSGTEQRSRSSAGLESRSIVQIVAVNLIHRPVILSIPSEHATLERLVTLLNQSPNIIPTVKILQAKTSEYAGPGEYLARFRLRSESVLIFDPSVVQTDQIPKLPPVYKPKVTTASYQHFHDSSSEDIPIRNFKGVIELAADSRLQGERSQLSQAEKMLLVPSALENTPNPKAKPTPEIPEFWIPVDKSNLSTKPPADGWEVLPETSPTVPPADPLAILPDKKAASDPAEKKHVPAKNSENKVPFQTRAIQGLIAAVFVTLLGAGWVFRRKLQQRVKTQFTFQTANRNFQPVKKKAGGILDALIENKLSLVEESFVFPVGLELQNPAGSAVRTVPILRTAPPVSQRKFRVDAGHAIQKPHAPSVVEEPVSDAPRSVTKTIRIDAIPEEPLVVSGLSESLRMIQQTIDASQSEMFLQSLELNIESELTQFPAIESFTADVYSPAWPEPASETEPADEIEAETPGGDESDSTPSEQPRSQATNRIDPPQTTSLRPHARHSGWVLDRVLVALHGVTRQ